MTATRLECGPLSAVLDGADLFDVRWGGLEVVQRIYVAVRDESWNTIPARVHDVRIDRTADGVHVGVDVTHAYADIDYAWRGRISLGADGRLGFEMDGQARGSFSYCKIGFNIHHGMRTHAGHGFRVWTAEGVVGGEFSDDLVPQLVREGTLTAMTPHFDRLEIDLGGVRAEFAFAGDRFEMQDHRNWIDANWKTYGTPLERGFPMSAEIGQALFQRMDLSVRGLPPASQADPVRIAWTDGSGPGPVLPRIGHLVRDSPTRSQYAALRRLRPAHVRVDLHAGQDPATQLERAVAVGEELRCRVEVAAFVDPGDVEAGTDALVAALAPAGHRIDRVIVLAETTGFSAFRGACPPRVAATVRSSLAAHGMAEVPIVTGTDQFFVDINRDRPDYTGLDGLVFAANPQVHACDDRSIMQNAQPIVDVVEFARRLYPSLDIVISPLDLLGANGPYPAGPPVDGGAPANEDRRLRTGFGAAWTCAALGAAARARVGSVTLFELAGPRGLVDDEPFPVLSLLTSLADQQDSPMLAVQVDDPDRVATLAFQTAAGPVLYVANLTGAPLTVVLPTGDELDVPGYAVAFTSEGGTSRIA